MIRYTSALLLPFALFCGQAQAANGFDAVKCGAAVPHALLAKTLPQGSDGDIESRYKTIGLKDVGGEEISNRLYSSSWLICGSEYMLILNRNNVVKDVLPIPPHSRTYPEFSDDKCQVGGKETAFNVVAILDNSAAHPTADSPRFGPGDTTLLPAKFAWKVDETHAKFVPIPVDGLGCPRGGIITLDGGA